VHTHPHHCTISSHKYDPPEYYSKTTSDIYIYIYIYIYTQYERAMEEAGLRGGHGESEQIASVSESWRVQGSTTKHQTVL